MPVPPEIVRRIIDAAWLTGSSLNGQPWYFIVLEERQTRDQLGAQAWTGHHIARAPPSVVVGMEASR
jgi:nitroreductase